MDKKFRFKNKTVAIPTMEAFTQLREECVEHGVDISTIEKEVVKAVKQNERSLLRNKAHTPCISFMDSGLYWGRKWFYDKIYPNLDIPFYKPLPKYYMPLSDGSKLEVPKDVYDNYMAYLKEVEEAKRKANLFRPNIKKMCPVAHVLQKNKDKGWDTLLTGNYVFDSSVDAENFKRFINFEKNELIARYTYAWVQQYGNGYKDRDLKKDYAHDYFIAYDNRAKKFKVTYSTYTRPMTVYFGTKEKAMECLAWLKDLKIV